MVCRYGAQEGGEVCCAEGRSVLLLSAAAAFAPGTLAVNGFHRAQDGIGASALCVQ
jgi:hypothetical protein